MDTISFYVYYIIVLLFSITIHEVSHGLMANSLGDPTAKNLGRLTLNPLKHLDFFGSFILPIISGFHIAYAKPVPFNPDNLTDKKYGPLKVALVGPFSNIILALLFGFSIRFMPDVFTTSLIPELFKIIIVTNLWLAIFNLFPIPPLDGHWILKTIFPGLNFYKSYQYSLVLLLLLIFFVAPLLSPVVGVIFRLITGISL